MGELLEPVGQSILVTNCSFNGNIDNIRTSDSFTAGIASVGAMYTTNVDNCYTIGNITGNKYVGGIVGYRASNITNSYNEAKIVSNNGCAGRNCRA